MSVAVIALLMAAQQSGLEHQCILDRVSAGDRGAIYEESSVQGTASGPAFEAFARAADACRQALGWNQNQTSSFAVLAHVSILGEQARSRLMAAGLDPALVLAWFRAQPLATRTSMDFSEPAMEPLITHLHSAGISEEMVEAQATAIGSLHASLVLLERLDHGMGIQ